MKLSEVESPKVALVTWLDATHYEGWFGPNDDLPIELTKMESVGWLIKQDEDIIALAMSYSQLKMGDILAIPAGWVQSIDVLPPVEEEKSPRRGQVAGRA